MRIYILFGVVFGFLSVALGTIGAHILEGSFMDDRLSRWDTAVQYQMFHTIPLLLIRLLNKDRINRLISAAGIAFTLGVLLFSGSLYTYVITDQSFFAMITPLGGLSFLTGWV